MVFIDMPIIATMFLYNAKCLELHITVTQRNYHMACKVIKKVFCFSDTNLLYNHNM